MFQKKIHAIFHFNFIDRIVKAKRVEILNLIKNELNLKLVKDCLDIGTTEDSSFESSNYIINNIPVKKKKSLSNQNISSGDFDSTLVKSITEDLGDKELKSFRSDLVISSAVIEHVGSFDNQRKMIENMIKLSKKYIVFTTPNKFHPIEFHTKLLLLHWLPNRFFARILQILGFEFFSKEENLNLLSKRQLNKLTFHLTDNFKFKIYFVRLFFFKSNFVVIGYKKK